ncbi:hypothetical protein U3A55_03155 [Salarchaeum sp. III]|uniref:hypothetical protein n=1 Tax=Salarchaeum sp. III TaxID=3107927 RepID=UPI002ED80A37
MEDDNYNSINEGRRNVLKKIGSVGVGGAAVTAGLTSGAGNARGMLYVSPSTVYSEEVETLCDLAPEGLSVWTAASLTDPVPGDEIFLGITTASAGAACAVRDEFVEHYPEADTIKFKRADEQHGEISEGDIVVRPEEQTDLPWWFPPIA